MKPSGLLAILLCAGCSLTRLDLGGADPQGVDAGGPGSLDGGNTGSADAALSDASDRPGLDAAPDAERPAPADGAVANDGSQLPASDASATDANVDPGPSDQVRTFAVGGTFTCAVRNDGKVKCWGAADFGQLGIAAEDALSDCAGTPCDHVPRSSTGLVNVAELALGDRHGCLLDESQNVACWGSNRFGELGRGSSDADPHVQPVALTSLTDAYAIASGRFHTCAIEEGKVYCWGLNHKGQLGITSTNNCTVNDASLLSELGVSGPEVACETEPVLVPGFSGALSLFAFGHQTCAINGGGELRCWGQNDTAQLAQTATTSIGSTAFPRQDQHAFALGGGHGCGSFGVDNRLRCWGSHAFGALGVGSTALSMCGAEACSTSPITLADLMSVELVAAGERHSCATTQGKVSCWGSDARGQLGNSENAIGTCGSDSCSKTPVEVVGLSEVMELRSGPYHICALTQDHALYCWGANDLVQSGGADKIDRNHASLIYGLGDPP